MSKALSVLTAVLFGCLLMLFALEVLLRLLPVQDGLFGADLDPAWPAHHMVPNGLFTFSSGWDLHNVRHGTINSLGYVAPFAYQPGTSAVVVVGDSFIEGVMNSYPDTLQGQLSRRLRDAPAILNFGTSGAGLPDYVGISSMVTQRFHVDWVVILVVAGDFTDGFAPAPGYFAWDPEATPPVSLRPDVSRGPVAKVLRSLALVRYVRGNLHASLEHLLHSSTSANGGPGQCAAVALRKGDRELIESYSRSLPAAYGVPAGRVILIFDSDRTALYRSNARGSTGTCATRDTLARAELVRAARALGEHVVEMGPIFADRYKATGQHLDYLPFDAHWNASAHGLAAAQVAKIIDADATAPH